MTDEQLREKVGALQFTIMTEAPVQVTLGESQLTDEILSLIADYTDGRVKIALRVHDIKNAIEHLDVQCREGGECINCNRKYPRLHKLEAELATLQKQGEEKS